MAQRMDVSVEEIRWMAQEPALRWPVAWSAIWVGALATLALALMIGLIGFAVGAHEAASSFPDWAQVRFLTLIFNIGGAFFASVAGGWIAARIAGIREAAPAALHGAIAWLLTVPLLLTLAALGGTARFGSWYAGLGGSPVWAPVAATIADPHVAMLMRNASLAALAVLVLGLAGGVIGGWFGSGEPMTLAGSRRGGGLGRARVA